MKYKDDIGTSHTIEVLDQVIVYDSPLNAPQLPLERLLSLSIFYGDKEVDSRESEVLAMMNAQPIRKDLGHTGGKIYDYLNHVRRIKKPRRGWSLNNFPRISNMSSSILKVNARL